MKIYDNLHIDYGINNIILWKISVIHSEKHFFSISVRRKHHWKKMISANTAASFMGLMWFSTYSAYFLTQMLYEDVSLHTKFLLSLISNAAMGFVLQMLIICEGTSQGKLIKYFFIQFLFFTDFKIIFYVTYYKWILNKSKINES